MSNPLDSSKANPLLDTDTSDFTIPVIVTSSTTRNVVYGYIRHAEAMQGLRRVYYLARARVLIRWDSDGGIGDMAVTGAEAVTQIGPVHQGITPVGDIDAVIPVTADAAASLDEASAGQLG